MRKRIALAPAQTISAEQAACFVRSGMWLDYGVALCQPDVFDKALADRRETLQNVKIRSCLSMRPRAVVDDSSEGGHFFLFSWHFSGYDRKYHDAGRCNYMPLNLGEVPDYYRRFIDPVDIVILKTCPMDEDGYFNFSAANIWHRAVIERAKLVIVEVSTRLPYVFGEDNGVHVSEVDYIIEGDDEPAAELPNPPPTDIDRAVARRIAAEIEDGACLQIGIGGMPNAVCALLLESGVRDLGVHTEMLTDGIVELYKAGRITGARKKLDPGKIVFTFALGSSDTLRTRSTATQTSAATRWTTPTLRTSSCRTTAWSRSTTPPRSTCRARPPRNRTVIATSAAPAANCNSCAAPMRRTAAKSFICLASTYEKRGERRSRIVLNLTPGNIVTTPRSDVMYVVTEYGMVNLKGKSVAERAMALISIAHPDFRERLEREAYEHRLIPRGVSF